LSSHNGFRYDYFFVFVHFPFAACCITNLDVGAEDRESVAILGCCLRFLK
jgi:hypothetical protein